MPPLAIACEGATTNGDYILPFKKGAFAGFKSVKPLSVRYYSNYVCINNGMLNLFPHFFLIVSNPYMTVEVKEFPVFKPNDYFWEHHWSESSGEEKW